MDWKFILYLFILVVSFILVNGVTNTTPRVTNTTPRVTNTTPPPKVIQCYGCSWTADQGYGTTCLNQTESERPFKCYNGTCRMSDMWDKKTGKLKSIYRGCGYKESGSECVPDYTNVNCERRCDTDKCNTIPYDANHTLDLSCFDFHCTEVRYKKDVILEIFRKDMGDLEIDFPVSVVLPAGGCGERMSINRPKQYCEVLNRPLIVFTLDTFNRIPWIQNVVVTVSKNYVEYVKELTQNYGYEKVMVVEGGTARHRSIYCGLKALENVCNQTDIVIIHDAVRIFAEERLMKEIVMAAKLNGAAGVSRPLVSTVIAVDSDGFIEESLDRNKYRASEMPQAFRYSAIKTAYDKATDYDFDYGTECLLLAYKYTNTKAEIIVGPPSLWKVTYLKDLHAAEGMLKELLIKIQLIGCNLEMEEKLKTHISKHRLKVSEDTTDSIEDIKDKTANSYVFIYNSFKPDKIQSNSLKCVEREHSSPVHPLIDSVIVHVIKMEAVTMVTGQHYIDCVKLFQSLAVSLKKNHYLIYGILFTDSNSLENVSEMVGSILWKRDLTLNGQVFLAPSEHS